MHRTLRRQGDRETGRQGDRELFGLLVSLSPCLLVFFGLAAVGCSRAPQGLEPVDVEPHVRLTRPGLQTIERRVGQPGFLEAYEQTAIYAKVAGYIEKWNVDIGDKVKKGQVLATIYDPELKAEYQEKIAQFDLDKVQIQVAEQAVEVAARNWDAAKAQIKEAQARINKAQADIDRWESEVTRLNNLASEGVVNRQVLEESRKQLKAYMATREAATASTSAAEANELARKADLAKARVDVKAAEARAVVSRETVKRLKALVGYTSLIAPYDGKVTLRNANVGDYVQPGSGDLTTGKGTPIYVVARTDKVRIYVDVPESQANRVQNGTKATVRIGNDEFPGSVTRTSWALRLQSRTLRAEIDLPNPDARLLPGAYAYGELHLVLSQVCAVPRSAVVEIGNQDCFYLYEKGRAVQTAVETGMDDSKWIEVIRKRVNGKWVPITGEEEVILGDLAELTNGQAVRVE